MKHIKTFEETSINGPEICDYVLTEISPKPGRWTKK